MEKNKRDKMSLSLLMLVSKLKTFRKQHNKIFFFFVKLSINPMLSYLIKKKIMNANLKTKQYEMMN